ncbi:hypothetical protein [Escherichia coli]
MDAFGCTSRGQAHRCHVGRQN